MILFIFYIYFETNYIHLFLKYLQYFEVVASTQMAMMDIFVAATKCKKKQSLFFCLIKVIVLTHVMVNLC